MTDTVIHLFLAKPTDSVLFIHYRDDFMTKTLAAANENRIDGPRDTVFTAIAKLQRWKTSIVERQRGNLPFHERQELHALWKQIDACEQDLREYFHLY